MIAKHIPMEVIKKSSVSELVKYVVNSQSKEERVGQVTVTNCHSDDPLDAALEIEAKQALNTRAVADKTYHLVISFAPHENPSPAVLKAIEARICKGLGFGEHQRVSAIHHDTDHLHMHLAINKVHPIHLTNVTPYYDYKKLGQLCEKLEIEYGLVRTNHQANQRGAASRAVDMERTSGIESLLGWIKRECLEVIKQVSSWEALHHVLREYGLVIQERGAGFVFSTSQGIHVKASSVARDFSKQKLEEKLGPFEKAQAQSAEAEKEYTPKHSYQERPLPSRVNTVELYAQYRQEQQNQQSTRTSAWHQARDKKNRQLDDIKRQYRLKRATIKAMANSASKKILYSLAYKTFQEDMEKVRLEYAATRQRIYHEYTRRTWVDWLQYQAENGNEEALSALRARRSETTGNSDALTGKEAKDPHVTSNPTLDSVTKMGTIIYRVGNSAIRDDGDELKVAQGTTHEGLVAALQMAAARYGTCIIVKGSTLFKKKIVEAAVVAEMAITFEDVVLEKCRQELLTLLKEEKSHEQRAEGQTDKRRTEQDRYAADSRANGGKQNISAVGRKPPPECQNRLRELSELRVVHVTEGSEMLLSRHVPSHLEQQGTNRTDGVRRTIHLTGEVIDDPLRQAAEKYIAEREAKRWVGMDILKHIHYNGVIDAPMTFAGIRRIDEQPLALLKLDKEIMVLPITEKTAKKLKRLSIGDALTVSKDGRIKVKGQSRKN